MKVFTCMLGGCLFWFWGCRTVETEESQVREDGRIGIPAGEEIQSFLIVLQEGFNPQACLQRVRAAIPGVRLRAAFGNSVFETRIQLLQARAIVRFKCIAAVERNRTLGIPEGETVRQFILTLSEGAETSVCLRRIRSVVGNVEITPLFQNIIFGLSISDLQKMRLQNLRCVAAVEENMQLFAQQQNQIGTSQNIGIPAGEEVLNHIITIAEGVDIRQCLQRIRREIPGIRLQALFQNFIFGTRIQPLQAARLMRFACVAAVERNQINFPAPR